MNILHFNIYGCSSLAKKRNLKNSIIEGIFEIIMIQVRFNSERTMMFFNLGSHKVEWTSKPSQGNSRVLLIMWKAGFFNLMFSFKGEGYVGINVIWKGISIYLVNVYSFGSINKNKEF
ncbi:unnamed protein product [Lathyrus sativus]|nr:unnamed protein product [Lathyrus sativus]